MAYMNIVDDLLRVPEGLAGDGHQFFVLFCRKQKYFPVALLCATT
jgi:hypothetical protein